MAGMAYRQKLDCHPEVIRCVIGSEKHRQRLHLCVPTARLGISGSYALVNHPLEYMALMHFLSEYDHLEYEFESHKITLARALSKFHREKLNYQDSRYEDGDDIYISWSSEKKVHISGVKTKLRGKLIELKWLVNYETVDHSFTLDTYSILSLGGVFDELRLQFGEKLLITQTGKNGKVMLTGGKKERHEASAFLTKKTNEIIRTSLDDIAFDPKKTEFLRKCMEKSTFAESKVIEAIQRVTAGVSLRPHGHSVLIAGVDKTRIDSAIFHLNMKICCEKLPLQIDPEIFRLDEWKEIRKRTLEKFAVLAIDEVNETLLTGLRTDICQCIDEMKRYRTEVIITLTPATAKLFLAHGEQFIANFPTADLNISIQDSGQVIFRGKKTAFAPAREIFQSKLGQIATKELRLTKSAVDFLESEEGKRIVERYEKNLECSISVPIPSQKNTEDSPRVQLQARFDPNALGECSVQTAAGSKVQIQLYGHRDITRQRCDVLIHPFCRNTDFQTGISESILSKAGVEVQCDLTLKLIHSGKSTVLTSAGNLPSCKHIVHSRIPSCTDGATVEDDLINAMQNSFRAADYAEAKVVAIPVKLGTQTLGLQSVGKPIAEALKSVMPLWLERLDIIGLGSSRAELISEFSSEIAENVCRNPVNAESERGRRTIILKRPKWESPTFPAFNLPRMNFLPDKWVSVIQRRLRKANERGNKAIEIPIPPHGNPTYSARLMRRTLENFKEIRPSTIQLRIIDADVQTISAYEAAFCGMEIADEDRRTHRLIGPVKLSVKVGDITEESTDAIVNWTSRDFNLLQGPLSNCILQKAGLEVLIELQMDPGRIVRLTRAGGLRCSRILHACVPEQIDVLQTERYREDMGKTIMEILRNANESHLSTISISPTDTGSGILSAVDVAFEIRRAVEKFVQSGRQEIFTHDVNIILTDGNMTKKILSRVIDLPYREGSGGQQEGREENDKLAAIFLSIALFLWGIIKYFLHKFFSELFPGPQTQSADTEKVLVSAFSHDNAHRASESLQSEIKSHEEIISDKRISCFDKAYRWKSQWLEKCYNVDITVPPYERDKMIISGFGSNPSLARREIEAILKRCPEPDADIATWKRVSKEHTMSFSEAACVILERAFERRLPVAHIEEFDKDGEYEVKYDISLSEMHGNDSGLEPTLRRVAKPNRNPALPIEWEQMGKVPLGIPVLPGSDEFKRVENALLLRGARFHIVDIERIQNRSLYMQYRAKKMEVVHKHTDRSNVQIQRVLFRGTSEESIECILNRGFTRNCSGKAKLFGRGNYFSADPKLAHNDAEEAKDGSRKIFLADVLTGIFTKGSRKIRVLPKIRGTSEHYDSLVDDEMNPKKFVIFDDAAAYPRYLIKYKLLGVFTRE